MQQLAKQVISQTAPAFRGKAQELSTPVASELELKFVVAASTLARQLRLEELPRVLIKQSYFHPENLKPLLRIAGHLLKLDRDSLLKHDLTSARIRCEDGDSGKSYALQLKSPKEHLPEGKLERAELSISLTKALYRELLAHATNGELIKTRFHWSGEIFTTADIVPCCAEIDLLHSAGTPMERKLWRVFDFASIDVELPCRSLIRPLRAGKHSFDLLSTSAIELSALDRPLQRALSSRRLAREGFDKKAERTLSAVKSLIIERPEPKHGRSAVRLYR